MIGTADARVGKGNGHSLAVNQTGVREAPIQKPRTKLIAPRRDESDAETIRTSFPAPLHDRWWKAVCEYRADRRPIDPAFAPAPGRDPQRRLDDRLRYQR